MNTTIGTMTSAPLTIETLKEVAAKIAALGEEPIRAYMKREGFDPERGGLLVMPDGMRGQFGPYGAPAYVKFSKIVASPVMLIDPMYELRQDLRCVDRTRAD